MTDRQPWLRGAAPATRPYGDALRAPSSAPVPLRGRWLAADPATGPGDASAAPAPAAALCPGCAELEALRATVEAARAEAIAQARRDGDEATAALRARLAASIEAIDRARTTRTEAMTEQVVELALGLCAELAPAAAAIDRRGLVQLVARSLTEAGGARELVVQVSAEDAAAVGTQLPAGMVYAVQADLVPGEVRVDAPRLIVDGRWATRLAALREPLIALVRAAEPAFELATAAPIGGDAEPAVELATAAPGGSDAG